MNELFVILHILSTIWMVSGLLGRELSRTEARKAMEIPPFLQMSRLAGRFEDQMVRPGSMALAVTGIALAFIQGWPMLGILQGSPVNWLLAANLLALSMVAIIIFIFIPRGKQYDQALQDAIARGEITPALRASWQDPVVRAAHIYEGITVLLIITLMVAKPF